MVLEIELSEIIVDLFILQKSLKFMVIDLNEGKNLTFLLSPVNF